MSSVTLPATNSKVEVQPTAADPTINRQVVAIGAKDGGTGDPLAQILAKLSADPATQATLAAVLTKLGALNPYAGAAVITPGTAVTPGVGVFIACTEAGNVRLKLANDSILDVPVAIGASMIDNLAVKDVVAGSTTATVVVSVLVKA